MSDDKFYKILTILVYSIHSIIIRFLELHANNLKSLALLKVSKYQTRN